MGRKGCAYRCNTHRFKDLFEGEIKGPIVQNQRGFWFFGRRWKTCAQRLAGGGTASSTQGGGLIGDLSKSIKHEKVAF